MAIKREVGQFTGISIDDAIAKLQAAKAAGAKELYCGAKNPCVDGHTLIVEDQVATAEELDALQGRITQSVMDRGRTADPGDLRAQQWKRLEEVHNGISVPPKTVYMFDGFF